MDEPCKVQRSRFNVQGSGLNTNCSRFKVQGSRFRVRGMFQVLTLNVERRTSFRGGALWERETKKHGVARSGGGLPVTVAQRREKRQL